MSVTAKNVYKHSKPKLRGGGYMGMQRKQARAVAAVFAFTFGLSACALPGYNSGAIDDGNAWYDFGSNTKSATYEESLSDQEVDFNPRVMTITPALLRRQSRERAMRTLSESEMRLTEAPESIPNYRIGAGDVLQVVVFGHPELTNPGGTSSGEDIQGQLVSADGTIFYPYVGEIDAEGKTLRELRDSLSQGLSQYIREPQVDVRVRQYRSQRVYISGDIVKPCTVPITDITLTVLQALDQCDTLASKEGGGVGVQNVRLIREGESTLLDLNQIYASGRPVPLKPGDRLLIDDSANRIFMVGEFDEQMALPYSTGGMSLSDAIADAGGVNLESADTSAIYVLRGFMADQPEASQGTPLFLRPDAYKLDMSNPSGLLLANQFELKPRDVVFAAPASLVNFNRALALILPSLNAFTQSYYLYDRIGRDNN